MARDARIYSTRIVTYNRNNDPAVRFESIGSIEIIDRLSLSSNQEIVCTHHPSFDAFCARLELGILDRRNQRSMNSKKKLYTSIPSRTG